MRVYFLLSWRFSNVFRDTIFVSLYMSSTFKTFWVSKRLELKEFTGVVRVETAKAATAFGV